MAVKMVSNLLKRSSKMDALERSLRAANRRAVLVGLPGPSEPHDKAQGLTVAEIGAVHEYGSPANGIPSRPFMRQTWSRHGASMKRLMENLGVLVTTMRIQPDAALKKAGALYENLIKDTITNGSFVPLAKATSDRKGSTKPLIDTNQLRGSVTYKLGRTRQ